MAKAVSTPNSYPSSRDYDTAERMDTLRGPSGPGFLPVTKAEVDAAFLRWWHSAQGGEPLDVTLEKVFYDQMQSPNGRPEPAILAIVGERAAYARQALKDHRVLMRHAKDLIENPVGEDATITAAQYLRGIPAHDGPGQLVRFVDLGRIADGVGPDSFDFNPLGGAVKKGKISSSWGVVDPYTVTQPERKVSNHIGEVLDGVLASDLLPLYEAAANDQEARLKFWGDAMVEAHREDLARPIAHTILTLPGMTNYYPEYSQQ